MCHEISSKEAEAFVISYKMKIFRVLWWGWWWSILIFFFLFPEKIRDGGRLPLYPYHPKGYRCLLQKSWENSSNESMESSLGLQRIEEELTGENPGSSVSWFLIGAASHNWIFEKPSEMHPFPFLHSGWTSWRNMGLWVWFSGLCWAV